MHGFIIKNNVKSLFLINLVCCPCLISPLPNHIKDDLLTINEKADITEHITGMKVITVIVQAGITRRVDNLILC